MPLLCGHMSDRGIVLCEHEKGLELPESFGSLVKRKTYRYGKTEVTLYRNGNEEEAE